MINPIPEYILNHLKNPNSNFSLLFPRLVDWDNGNEFKKNEKAIESLEKFKSHLICSSDQLKNTHINQKEYIDFMNGSEINAKLVSPFITGLGSGHPTETGMILDRNTGVPYIPASSIKGVLRTAYAVSIADENGNADDKKLDEIFGGEDNSSKVVFLDAYPERIPTIQSDIMNPHFSKYYGGENTIPLENENPVPIKFLSVKEGCNFIFRYIVKDENLKSEIEKVFKIAFEKIGFGGKTSIGYGRFEMVKESGGLSNTAVTNSNKPVSGKEDVVVVEKIKGQDILTHLHSDNSLKIKVQLQKNIPKDKQKAGALITVRLNQKSDGSWTGVYLPNN